MTGDNGSVTLKNLHLGTYRVKEMQAPKNFYNKGETKDVAIAYAGQMAEAAFANATFLNDSLSEPRLPCKSSDFQAAPHPGQSWKLSGSLPMQHF